MAARDRPDPYAFETLWRQYRACRHNKRGTINALRFELNAEENLLVLQQELRDHTYRPGPSICFVTDGPKPREVFAADFRDRVVHHLLVSWQQPVFEREFIHDSYACRKGKGTLAASDRLMQYLRQATANGRWPAWALHLDVASFFPSIRKQVLSDQLARRIRDPEVRAYRAAIAAFLRAQLALTLRADGDEPRCTTTGVEFVGWRTWWGHRVPRPRTMQALRARVAAFARAETTTLFQGKARRIAWRAGPVAALRGSLASYAGHLQHGAAGQAWQVLWTEGPWLGACFRRLGSGLGGRALVFYRVGRYVEFRGPGLERAMSVLGLRRVVLPRAGYRYAAGFPVWLLGRYVRRALDAGVVVAFAEINRGVTGLAVRETFPRRRAVIL